MISTEKALSIMKIERECVIRQDTSECKRYEYGCGACDLVQDGEDVIAAYDRVIEVMKEQLKVEEATGWFKRMLDKEKEE